MKTAFLGASALSLALCVSVPATAQPEAEGPSVANDQGLVGDQQRGNREIVVTATRRAESIQDVPVAVTAFDEEALEQAGIDDIRDLAGRVPSLVIDPVNAGPSAAAISIRGISFEDIEKSFDPAVGVVVDGVPIGTNTGQLLDSFDLASIEVLRGPQGTLFGRNTIAGVINVRRTRPTGEFGFKGAVSYAEFETWRGRAVVNTPWLADTVAVKGFFFWDDTEGYIDNIVLGGTQGGYRSWAAGATALIEPLQNVSALITYEHRDEDGETSIIPTSDEGSDLICLQVPVPGLGLVRAFGVSDRECSNASFRSGIVEEGDDLYTGFQNIPTPVEYRVDSITGELVANVGAFELTSVTGWQTSEESVTQDFDASSISFFHSLRVQDYEQFTQELRVQGDVTDNLDVLVGAFYFDSEYNLSQDIELGFIGAEIFQRTTGNATSWAVFTDVTLELGRFAVSGGVRYTEDEKALFTNYGLSADGSCGVPIPGFPEFDCDGEETFDQVTWRAALEYDIDGDRLIYASYDRGFRSGGFNGRAGSPSSLGPYQPETVNAYEIGLKADWLDNRLRTNFAAFYSKYDDKQEETVRPTPPPFDAIQPQETVVINAASAEYLGFEAEISAVITEQLYFRTSLSLLDADYEDFTRTFNIGGVLTPLDASTLELRRAPEFTYSVGLDYSREIGAGRVDFSTNFRFIDEYFTCIVPAQPIVPGQIINDPRCEADDKTDLGATLAYTQDFGALEAKFSVFGRNILDDRGISGTLPVAGLFTFSGLRPPQQFGAEVQVKF